MAERYWEGLWRWGSEVRALTRDCRGRRELEGGGWNLGKSTTAARNVGRLDARSTTEYESITDNQ